MLMIATPHHIVQTSVQYGKEGDFMTSVKTSLIFALRCAKRKAGDYALRLRAVRVQAAAAARAEVAARAEAAARAVARVVAVWRTRPGPTAEKKKKKSKSPNKNALNKIY